MKHQIAALFMALFLAGKAFAETAESAADALAQRPELQAFISGMVEKYGFERTALQAVFRQVELKPGIISAIGKPAESRKPWDQYRPQFLTPSRIGGGVRFCSDNAAALARAQREYGVPEEVIAAIIGVETRYGKQTGSYRVMDALTTLALDFPRRAPFFLGELENYLLLAEREGIDPFSLKGSYAGAMGIAQFMPGSYLRYAVDFDGDGRRDIGHSAADAIGSVANYLAAHGWRPDQPVAVPAQVEGKQYRALLGVGFDSMRGMGELQQMGVTAAQMPPVDGQAQLLSLETGSAPEFWLGFHNFYVITRYNRSVYYAMAVYQLSREIRAMRQQEIGLSALCRNC
jgi:membrane-bound lytic murein transglycosylase B